MEKGFNGIILVGYTKEKSLSEMLSGEDKKEEFVTLAEYEKLEKEYNEVYTESLSLKSDISGLENHVDMLQSENKILIAEIRELGKSLSSVSVALAEIHGKNKSLI